AAARSSARNAARSRPRTSTSAGNAAEHSRRGPREAWVEFRLSLRTIDPPMSDTATHRLDELSLGFRERPLSYDELTRQVRSWADAFPELCRLQSIGRTP